LGLSSLTCQKMYLSSFVPNRHDYEKFRSFGEISKSAASALHLPDTAPTDCGFFIFRCSRSAGFSSPLLNQSHERMLPAAAPPRASGVMPLLGNGRQPRSVANLRSGIFRFAHARARRAVPVVIVHGISNRRNRGNLYGTLRRALKQVRSSAVTTPLPHLARSGQAT
jgi:hypothetical protein